MPKKIIEKPFRDIQECNKVPWKHCIEALKTRSNIWDGVFERILAVEGESR